MYKIKPLKWKRLEGRRGVYAETIFGDVSIYDANEWYDDVKTIDWQFECDCGNDYGVYGEPVKSLKAGKARAWEWYLSRLLPGLEVA